MKWFVKHFSPFSTTAYCFESKLRPKSNISLLRDWEAKVLHQNKTYPYLTIARMVYDLSLEQFGTFTTWSSGFYLKGKMMAKEPVTSIRLQFRKLIKPATLPCWKHQFPFEHWPTLTEYLDERLLGAPGVAGMGSDLDASYKRVHRL